MSPSRQLRRRPTEEQTYLTFDAEIAVNEYSWSDNFSFTTGDAKVLTKDGYSEPLGIAFDCESLSPHRG